MLLVAIHVSLAALNIDFRVDVTKTSFFPNETIPVNLSIINREVTFPARNVSVALFVGRRVFNYNFPDLSAAQSVANSLILPEQPPGTYLLHGVMNYTGYFGEKASLDTYSSFEVTYPPVARLPRNVYIKSIDLPDNVTARKTYTVNARVANDGDIPADLTVVIESLDANVSKNTHLDPHQTTDVSLDVLFYNPGISLVEAKLYAAVDDIKYLMNYDSKNVYVKENKVAKLELDRTELVDEADGEINQNDNVELNIYLSNSGNDAANIGKSVLSSPVPEITVKQSVDYKLILATEVLGRVFEIETKNAKVGKYNLTLDVSYSDSSSSFKSIFSFPVDVVKDGCSADDQCATDERCSNRICTKIDCGYCQHATNHICIRYQCCSDAECGTGQFCDVDNTCKRKICADVSIKGNSADKLDIVFVGGNYSEDGMSQFENDVKAHSDKILSVYPFSAYSDKINVRRIDKFVDLGCKIYGDRCLSCDNAKVTELASYCPYDKVIVIVNTDRWAGCAGLYGTAAASSRYPYISLHEFGHSFGGLWDEYSYGGNGSSASNSPNCDDQVGCPKWNNMSGTGCFKECTADNFFRSIAYGIMRTVSDVFGKLDENHLIQSLNKYK